MKKTNLIRVAGCALSVALACSPVVLWTAPAYAESSEIETYSSTQGKVLKEGVWDTAIWQTQEDEASWSIKLTEPGKIVVYYKVAGWYGGDLHNVLISESGIKQDYTIYKNSGNVVQKSGGHYDPFISAPLESGSYTIEPGNYTYKVYGNLYSDSGSCGVSVKLYLDIPGKFVDVDSQTPHSDDIVWLGKSRISEGWLREDGREFCPYDNVARADMAAFLYRLAGEPEYAPPSVSPFKDVETWTPHYLEICWLASTGISEGWTVSDGKEFRPYDKVTRCDMAAFLYRMAGSPSYTVSGSPFIDCSEKTPHYKEVCWLASTGVSAGWDVSGGKEFRSYTKVARADMAAFLRRMKDKGLVLPV